MIRSDHQLPISALASTQADPPANEEPNKNPFSPKKPGGRRFWWKRILLGGLIAICFGISVAIVIYHREPDFCTDRPIISLYSRSVGSPSSGSLIGGVPLPEDSSVQLLPVRHRRRCLNWGTSRLVEAIARAGAAVQKQLPDSPPLGVGNISRAAGGPITDYSRSHQAGRDADLAFFALDDRQQPVPMDDLVTFRPDLTAAKGLHFDVVRNWLLVKALLSDSTIEVRWLLVSNPLREALLAEASRRHEPDALVQRAQVTLHQPSDGAPHDDHFHLRISCSAEEKAQGCR